MQLGAMHLVPSSGTSRPSGACAGVGGRGNAAQGPLCPVAGCHDAHCLVHWTAGAGRDDEVEVLRVGGGPAVLVTADKLEAFGQLEGEEVQHHAQEDLGLQLRELLADAATDTVAKWKEGICVAWRCTREVPVRVKAVHVAEDSLVPLIRVPMQSVVVDDHAGALAHKEFAAEEGILPNVPVERRNRRVLAQGLLEGRAQVCQLANVLIGGDDPAIQDLLDLFYTLGMDLGVPAELDKEVGEGRCCGFVAGDHDGHYVAIELLVLDQLASLLGGVVEHGREDTHGATNLTLAGALYGVGDVFLAGLGGFCQDLVVVLGSVKEWVVLSVEGAEHSLRLEGLGGPAQAHAEGLDKGVQTFTTALPADIIHVQVHGALCDGVSRHAGKPVVDMLHLGAVPKSGPGVDEYLSLLQQHWEVVLDAHGVEGARDHPVSGLPPIG
mmetsp:Transcript_25451/g.71177  ORF Transcript_25451/g.71177 Transcript_25451/m.71177 type:complete len:438 (+) Transcript_25451:2399-3712(+)